MSVTTVFIVAAIGGAFAFLRDIIKTIRDRRKRVTAEEAEAIRGPIEVRTMILDDTQKAVALQSAIMLALQGSLADAQRDNVRLKTENVALQVKVDASAERELHLYQLLGQARATGGVEGKA